MSEVVILTDTVIWGKFGNPRYMGAYAVANACRQAGHSTTVIDYFTRKPDFFEYVAQFLSEETVVVGISSTFLSTLGNFQRGGYNNRSELLHDFFSGELWFEDGSGLRQWMMQFKALLALRSPRAKVVLGGTKSQFALWRPEAYQDFDYIVLGPADRAFPEFVSSLKEGRAPSVKQHNAVSIIDNSTDVAQKICPEMFWTKQDGVAQKESLPLEISRGCVFNCKFCHYNKQESLRKNIDVLRGEMVRNFDNFGTDTYSFCDDCFNDHPDKVRSICEMFLGLPFKIDWVSYARVDVAVKFPWTLDLMMESGARGLYWGIESFDGTVARKAGKGTPPDKVKELLFRIKKEFSHRCLTEISLVAGLPGETEESMAETEKWLTENPVADHVSIGPLGLVPFVQAFDGKSFDYAEYSRNPAKYGFEQVSFHPDYWKHETMDLPRAKEWATRISKAYRAVKPLGLISSVWAFPHVKTLGFNTDEALRMFQDPATLVQYPDVVSRFQKHVENYWERLAKEAKLSPKNQRPQPQTSLPTGT